MARIRTIKPEFFTSEDIVGLSPTARLLYIALWCESDREGRLVWRPGTFKLRYFPADKINIETVCRELTDRQLVIPYGQGYAYIPTFLQHQHVNPREAASNLPVPDASARVNDASARVPHAQVGREGREGKGREGVEARQHARGARLPPDWEPSELLKAWAQQKRPDLDLSTTIEKFRNYWIAKPGKDGLKLDWEATFRTWVLGERQGNNPVPPDYSAVIANLKDGV